MITRKAVLASAVIALLLAAFITGDSLASGTWGNRLGEITKVSGSTYTLKTPGGVSKPFVVNSFTRYYSVDGASKTSASLRKGVIVDVIGPVGDTGAGVMTATTVIFMPNKLNMADWRQPRDYGRVTAVTKKTFTIMGRFGSVTYKVDSNTDWISSVDSTSELRVGMRALLAYTDKKVVLAIAAFTPH